MPTISQLVRKGRKSVVHKSTALALSVHKEEEFVQLLKLLLQRSLTQR